MTEEKKKALEEARRVLADISADKYEKEIAELREKYILDQNSLENYGYRKGKDAGIKQGEKDEKIKIAKNMLKENINIELITKVTGLTEEEVKNLKWTLWDGAKKSTFSINCKKGTLSKKVKKAEIPVSLMLTGILK